MGKIEAVMRDEIARLARREIRQQVEPLRKEVRELKRRIVKLERAVQPINKEIKQKKKAQLEKLSSLQATEDEVRAARITAEWVSNLRMKLNLSQAELASLVGVSVSAVRSWEYGHSLPRDTPRSALVALRKLGRRAALKLLEAKEEE